MAITVEDGTGMSDADAYVSVADADSYITKYVRNSSTWTSLATSLKELAIREATQSVDLLFNKRWTGYRSSEAQALDWPRSGGYDTDGYSVSGASVPTAVVNASVEMAWKHLNDDGPSTTTGDSTGIIADIAAGKNIKSESVGVGSVSTTTTYAGIKSQAKFFRKVELILQKLLMPRGAVTRA